MLNTVSRRRASLRWSVVLAAVGLPSAFAGATQADPFALTLNGMDGLNGSSNFPGSNMASSGWAGESVSGGGSYFLPAYSFTVTGGRGGNGGSNDIGGSGGVGGSANLNTDGHAIESSNFTLGIALGGHGGAAGQSNFFSQFPTTSGQGGDTSAYVSSTASASYQSFPPAPITNDYVASATSIAIGGDAGGSAVNDPHTLESRGGNAFANAFATSFGVKTAVANATATGGAGSTSRVGGLAGSANAFASAQNMVGDASASVTVTGGRGGEGLAGNGSSGASVFLSNNVSGTAGGKLSLSQTAIGGDGGYSGNEASFDFSKGVGGSAHSFLDVFAPSSVSSLEVSLKAVGGRGGDASSVYGGTGGSAYVGANLFGNGPVNADIEVVGGNGGNVGGGTVAGLGGLASLGPISVLSNSTARVSVSVTGGSGGNAVPGGSFQSAGNSGQSVFLFNSAFANGLVSTEVIQTARSGHAGDTMLSGSVGAGATSQLSQTASNSLLSLTANAFGGNGYRSVAGLIDGGYGGATIADSNATDTVGKAEASANANGGEGGAFYAVAIPSGTVPSGPVYYGTAGSGGVANSNANAMSPQEAIATTTVIGGKGGGVVNLNSPDGVGTLDPATTNGTPLATQGPGRGGDVYAISRATGTTATSTATANASAVGGAGGDAAFGTYIYSGAGVGGSARATAVAEAPGGASVFVEVVGGRGSQVKQVPLGGVVQSSGRGGDAFLDQASATAVTGNASVTAIVRAGAPGVASEAFNTGLGGVAFFATPVATSVSGDAHASLAVYGSGASDTNTSSLASGTGGSVFLTNQVRAITQTGALSLHQEAQAGNGDVAGSAYSELSGNAVELNSIRSLSLSTKAVGGVSRNFPFASLDGGAQARATFSAPSSFAAPVTLVAETRGAVGSPFVVAESLLSPGSGPWALTASAGHLPSTQFPAVSAGATLRGTGSSASVTFMNVIASAVPNGYTSNGGAAQVNVSVNPFLPTDSVFAIPGVDTPILHGVVDASPISLTRVNFATGRNVTITTEVDLSETAFDDAYLAITIPTFFSTQNTGFTMSVNVQDTVYNYSFADLQAAYAVFGTGVLAYEIDPERLPILAITLDLPEGVVTGSTSSLSLGVFSAAFAPSSAVPEPAGLLVPGLLIPALLRRRR